MLLIIGLGLDTKDLSVKALEGLKGSSVILLDQHTNRVSEEYIDYIEKESGKAVRMLSRKDLEENIRDTIAEAKNSNVSLLVSGDPFIATTHMIILDAANKDGIEWEVVHGSSILTAAIGESRLSPYRFGQVTTIPFWTKSYKPTSFMDTISRNMAAKAHTIVLLDYDYSKGAGLGVRDALECLLAASREKGAGISGSTEVISLGDIGKTTQVVVYSQIDRMLDISESLEGRIFTLIIPAELNFAEKEATRQIKTLP